MNRKRTRNDIIVSGTASIELTNKGMNNMSKWKISEDKKLIKLWEAGYTVSTIAKETKRTIPACRMRIKQLQDLNKIGNRYRKNYLSKDKRYTPTKSKLSKQQAMQQAGMNMDKTSTAYFITKQCDDIKTMLLKKNEAYGDSALTPVRVFSKASSDEQIKVRIDDKLNRLMQGKNILESDNDVIKDLIGYLILLLINQEKNN
jgi:hypothetical protein